MGKKKGKGKGQPQGPGDTKQQPEQSVSSAGASSSQSSQEPQQTQQQRGQHRQKQHPEQPSQQQAQRPPQQPSQQQAQRPPQQPSQQQAQRPPQQPSQQQPFPQQQGQRPPQLGPQQQPFPQQQGQRPPQLGPQQQPFPQQQAQRPPWQQPPQQFGPRGPQGFAVQQQQMYRGPPMQQQFGPQIPHQSPPRHWSPRPGMRPQSPPGVRAQSPPGTSQQPPPGFAAPSQQQQPRGPQRQQLPPQQLSPPVQEMQQLKIQEEKQPPQRGQQQQRPRQQQQRTRQQLPAQEQQPLPEKELSPPFGGQGDCLQRMALVKPGTKGRKIIVESNHLALNMGTLMEAIHYDVSIEPDTPKSLLRDVMNVFGRKHYPKRHPAFDGRKNLYSPVKLPFGDTDSISDTVKVEGENGTKEFKVEIKFARTVDLSPLHDMLKSKVSPQDALQCLDIVLRNAPANSYINAGRCFFTPPAGQIIDLGDGMEMYYGFYQSAIRGWKPLLNVDVAHKAFPQALNLLDLICELGSDYRNKMTREQLNRPLSDFLFRTLEKFIKTLKVKYEITGQSGSKRIYRVNGLGEPPSKAKFKTDDGRQMTVENYFQSVKRIRLNYPHLPTLWVGAVNRESKILLPLEFCTVLEGQAVNRKMNENQTSAMIKKAATSTDVRKQKIMNTLQKAKYNEDPCIKEFGFSVGNQFERLEARILQPPALLYKNNSVVTPSRGVWRSDRSKFLMGATINKWTVACVTRQYCKMDRLADEIYKMAGSSGIEITSKAIQPFTHIGPRQSLQDIIEYFRTRQDFDLIFVVVPNSGPQYSFVKKAAELNVGCLTQCIKEKTLFKLNVQTVVNILLKVNSKMNGTNHTFNLPSRPPIMNKPCMIMGADVTHPSPDAKDIPSVAAVTASHDPKAFQYNICWRLQPPKVEIIEDLCNITMEQLKFFYSKTGCKPERIVFFRDGVSEGQFREVQRAEIRAIQQACKKLQPEGYEPAITFLVVQKRHHTRLFPTNPSDSEDKNMNVPAGTCVDTMITNPTMQDFYLVSHASIQGVAKPTKYCTLWDDNNMSNDDMEQLTYHLCHMFTRCNRSVSYPAPTYYAHLAAARAKVYIENDKLNMEQLKRYQETYQIKECISKGKPMFFV